jgi:hypothetical protein
LGKAYIFVHKKVRDALYDVIEASEKRLLHGAIAKQLMATVEKPKDQMLFALAQHFNKSRDVSSLDPETEKLALNFNLRAGDTIRLKQGWTAANNYYRIALEIVDLKIITKVDSSIRRKIIERLADVNAGQTNFKMALQRYGELLQQPMSKSEYASAAAKASQLHIVCGNISESLSLIKKGLSARRMHLPSTGIIQRMRYFIGLITDVLMGSASGAPLVSGLKNCWAQRQRLGESVEVHFATAKLNYLLSLSAARHDRVLSEMAENKARDDVVNGRSSVSVAVKVIADRAGLCANYGAIGSAYKLFDVAEKVCRQGSLTRTGGYVSLCRAMTVDYTKGRFDDVAFHVKEAFQKIDPEQDRIAYAQLIVFKQYLDLLVGKFDSVEELNSEVRLTVPTRNWISPVSMSMLLFSLLIRGKRQRLVKIGEDYMRRRRAVGGREDLFGNIVSTLLVFARGEDDQARAGFSKIVSQHLAGRNGEILAVWQEDFVGIFLLVFPVFFEMEYGKQVMRNAEMFRWLNVLRKRQPAFSRFFQRRTVQAMVRARCGELTGAQNIKKIYDEALRESKVEGNVLVQSLCYLWFGSYLLSRGQQNRSDYLEIALKTADENGMGGLVAYFQRVMENLGIKTSLDLSSSSSLGSNDLAANHAWPEIVGRHLDYIVSAVNNDSDVRTDMGGTIEILKSIYPDSDYMVILADGIKSEPVLFNNVEPNHAEDLLKSVSPYFTIRSTLVLHISASSSGITVRGDLSEVSGDDLEKTLVPDEDLGSTQVLQPSMPAMTSGTATKQSILESARSKDSMGSSVGSMKGLVPIRAGGETIGLIVINDVGSDAPQEFHWIKRELDAIGAQVGWLLSQKFMPLRDHLDASGRGVPVDLSVMGGVYFENTPWLDIQLVGSLRKEREASWYLGLKWGAAQYLVVYCCVKGDVLERDRFAALLLYQVFVVRELVNMQGQARNEVADLRNHLQGVLNSSGLAGRMDEILFAYSLLEKDSEVVASGHYGPARPVVLGVENRVTAFNQASLRMRDGRDLRYWEVFAPMGQGHVFLVSYDTSRIDGGSKGFLSAAARSSQDMGGTKSATKLLETAVQDKLLPRYYVSITRRTA